MAPLPPTPTAAPSPLLSWVLHNCSRTLQAASASPALGGELALVPRYPTLCDPGQATTRLWSAWSSSGRKCSRARVSGRIKGDTAAQNCILYASMHVLLRDVDADVWDAPTHMCPQPCQEGENNSGSRPQSTSWSSVARRHKARGICHLRDCGKSDARRRSQRPGPGSRLFFRKGHSRQREQLKQSLSGRQCKVIQTQPGTVGAAD